MPGNDGRGLDARAIRVNHDRKMSSLAFARSILGSMLAFVTNLHFYDTKPSRIEFQCTSRCYCMSSEQGDCQIDSHTLVC